MTKPPVARKPAVGHLLLKGEVGVCALNSHGNYILNSHGNYNVDHGKSWKNHGIVFLNFCWNPESLSKVHWFYFKINIIIKSML